MKVAVVAALAAALAVPMADGVAHLAARDAVGDLGVVARAVAVARARTVAVARARAASREAAWGLALVMHRGSSTLGSIRYEFCRDELPESLSQCSNKNRRRAM